MQLKESEETNSTQRSLAEAQGAAFIKAVEHMIKDEADQGEIKSEGDYQIGYAVESAEGMYVKKDEGYVWTEPQAGENVHLEVVVCDGLTGRFLPYCDVHVTLRTAEDTEAVAGTQPFLWHPWLYHYGRNWHIEHPGEYTLTVTVTPPAVHRHDKENGRRLTKQAVVTFTEIKLPLGQKRE